TIAAAASNTATRTSKLEPDNARRRAATHRRSREPFRASSGDMLPPMRGFSRPPPLPHEPPASWLESHARPALSRGRRARTFVVGNPRAGPLRSPDGGSGGTLGRQV